MAAEIFERALALAERVVGGRARDAGAACFRALEHGVDITDVNHDAVRAACARSVGFGASTMTIEAPSSSSCTRWPPMRRRSANPIALFCARDQAAASRPIVT